MKNMKKNIYRYTVLLINLFIITVISGSLYAEENSIENKKNKYTFNYDQEIPTLIRYGSRVSGGFSKTGYIGFIQHEDGNSRSSIDIGYNITAYELAQPTSLGRFISIYGYGYVPLLPELLILIPDESVNVTMLSPLIGYSYSSQILSWFRIGFSINTGPVYVSKITHWKDKEEFESDSGNDYYDYDEWVEAYDAIGNISGKWGGRVNPKIKLYILNFSDGTAHFGLGFGYTQYVFADNHFNSYDIGFDYTKAF